MNFLIDGVNVHMYPQEAALFAPLYNARGGFVTFDDLYDAICGNNPEPPLPCMVYNHLHRLRARLAPTRFGVRNVKTRGYQLIRINHVAMAA